MPLALALVSGAIFPLEMTGHLALIFRSGAADEVVVAGRAGQAAEVAAGAAGGACSRAMNCASFS